MAWEEIEHYVITTQCLVPSDISPKWKNAVAVESSGDGNCLFNSVSICLTGDASKAEVLHKAKCN